MGQLCDLVIATTPLVGQTASVSNFIYWCIISAELYANPIALNSRRVSVSIDLA